MQLFVVYYVTSIYMYVCTTVSKLIRCMLFFIHTASKGEDYISESVNLMFRAGSQSGTSKCITIELVRDNTPEAEETVQLKLTTPSGVTLGPQTSATLRITETETVVGEEVRTGGTGGASGGASPAHSSLSVITLLTLSFLALMVLNNQ